jgi:hypothetical protein
MKNMMNSPAVKRPRGFLKAAGNPADEVWEVSYTEHSQAFKTHP